MGKKRQPSAAESRPCLDAHRSMIEYGEYNIFQIIFAWNGSTVKVNWPQIISTTCVSIITYVIMLTTDFNKDDWPMDVMHTRKSLLLPLLFLLIFRTGVSYRRFFEGRAHVGKMVKTCRELARGVSTYVTAEDPATQQKQANCAR